MVNNSFCFLLYFCCRNHILAIYTKFRAKVVKKNDLCKQKEQYFTKQ